MQTASSRIWTRVAKSISYDDNCYATSASNWSEINCKEKKHTSVI